MKSKAIPFDNVKIKPARAKMLRKLLTIASRIIFLLLFIKVDFRGVFPFKKMGFALNNGNNNN